MNSDDKKVTRIIKVHSSKGFMGNKFIYDLIKSIIRYFPKDDIFTFDMDLVYY